MIKLSLAVPHHTPKTLSSLLSPGFNINDAYVSSLVKLLFRWNLTYSFTCLLLLFRFKRFMLVLNNVSLDPLNMFIAYTVLSAPIELSSTSGNFLIFPSVAGVSPLNFKCPILLNRLNLSSLISGSRKIELSTHKNLNAS